MSRRGRPPYIPQRPPPSGAIPLVFGFSPQAKDQAREQARSALEAVLAHTGKADDIRILSRVGMYCVAMCEQMIKADTFEADGLADAAEAVTAGVEAVASVIKRFESSNKVGTTGPEKAALTGLVDAYEAIFSTATRRESALALSTLPSP